MSIKIASLFADIYADTSKLQKGLKDTKTQLGDFKQGMSGSILGVTTMTAAAGLGAAAIVGLGKAAYSAADATKNYRLEIGDLASAMSVSAEEASVLYNLADDMRVQMPAVEMAFKQMARNGLQPTVGGLADMADKYRQLEGPQERVKFLTDNFGRSGLELARIMDMGSDAILDYSDSLKDGLRVTDDQVQASKDLYAQQDALEEQWLSMRNTLAGALIPGLAEGLQTTNRWMDAWAAFADPLYEDIPFLLRGMAAMRDSAADRDFEKALKGLTDDFQEVGRSASDAALSVDQIAENADKIPEELTFEIWVKQMVGDANEAGRLKFYQWLAAHPTWRSQLTIEVRADMQVPNIVKGVAGLSCFVAGTLIHMADNSFKPIETIRPGDVVMAFDGARQMNPQVVVAVQGARREPKTVKLRTVSGEVECTPRHRFLRPLEDGQDDWIEAGELTEGDLVHTVNGPEAVLEKTWLADEVDVFNFTVDVDHTYIAGGFLVHNAKARARGGPLGMVNEVGEEGTEGIVNGMVIPHGPWEWLKRAGILPTRNFKLGGDVESGGPLNPDFKMFGTESPDADYRWPMSEVEVRARGGGARGGGGGGGGSTTFAVSSGTGAPTRGGASLPQAISEAGRAQAATIAFGMEGLAREIRELKETFPRAVRDAVQQVM